MSTDNIGKDKYEGRNRRLIEDLKIHPEAEIFPLMDDKSLDELAEDIKVNGMKEPIVIDNKGLVVDGRNRINACQRINVTTVECRMVYLDGDALRRQIISWNLRRRHLSESQRADIAANLANGTHGGDRSKAHKCGLTQAQAATQMGVSERSVQSAAAVHERGVPELQTAVKQGEFSVSSASAVATLPPEEQREVIKEGPQAVKQKAKEIREKRSQARADVKPKPPKDYEKLVEKLVASYLALPQEHRNIFLSSIFEEDPGVQPWFEDYLQSMPPDSCDEDEGTSVDDENSQEVDSDNDSDWDESEDPETEDPESEDYPD